MSLYSYASRFPALLLVSAAAIGCSTEPTERVQESRSALTLGPDTARIFGFEDSADWSGSSGTSTAHSEGTRSVKVAADGWKQIESRPFGPMGTVGTTLLLDVSLPAALPDWGDVHVIVKIPSAGVWWQELSSVPLQELAPNQFHTLTFSLPSSVADQIGVASDAVFVIAVNAPVGTYLLDSLRLSEPPGGTTGTTGSGGSTSTGSGGVTGSGGTTGGTGATGGTGGVPQPGETGPATSEGTVQGETVSVEHAFAILRQTPVLQTTIVLSDEPLSCELATGARTRPNLEVLSVSVLTDTPVTTGTYQFFPPPGEDLAYSASVALTRTDDECDNIEQASVASGHVTLDTISSTLVSGSYHVEFSAGAGSLDGTFVAPVCSVANEGSALCEQ